jgi:hypothetical protein
MQLDFRKASLEAFLVNRTVSRKSFLAYLADAVKIEESENITLFNLCHFFVRNTSEPAETIRRQLTADDLEFFAMVADTFNIANGDGTLLSANQTAELIIDLMLLNPEHTHEAAGEFYTRLENIRKSPDILLAKNVYTALFDTTDGAGDLTAPYFTRCMQARQPLLMAQSLMAARRLFPKTRPGAEELFSQCVRKIKESPDKMPLVVQVYRHLYASIVQTEPVGLAEEKVEDGLSLPGELATQFFDISLRHDQPLAFAHAAGECWVYIQNPVVSVTNEVVTAVLSVAKDEWQAVYGLLNAMQRRGFSLSGPLLNRVCAHKNKAHLQQALNKLPVEVAQDIIWALVDEPDKCTTISMFTQSLINRAAAHDKLLCSLLEVPPAALKKKWPGYYYMGPKNFLAVVEEVLPLFLAQAPEVLTREVVLAFSSYYETAAFEHERTDLLIPSSRNCLRAKFYAAPLEDICDFIFKSPHRKTLLTQDVLLPILTGETTLYHVCEQLSRQVAQRAVAGSGLFAPSIAEAAPGTAGLGDEAPLPAIGDEKPAVSPPAGQSGGGAVYSAFQ